MRIKHHCFLLLLAFIVGACDVDFGSESADGGTGQGGSMTRFAIQGNYAYVVSSRSIQVFRIGGSIFEKVNETSAWAQFETIFAKSEYLYLGAADGMYIYSIANPELPEFVFRYAHIVSCDPVVVQGNTAYITMRSGTTCNRGINALDIVNISDPHNPVLIRSYPMASPHGLGIDGTCLFLCDGTNGLKVYDVANAADIKLVHEVNDIDAYDVIPRQGLLTLTGEDGIFQFSYDCNAKQVNLLSKIPVEREQL